MNIPAPQKLLDFTGQIVLVTGSGSGIGAGIARRFGEAGASVAVNYLTSAEGAKHVVQEIAGMGAQAAAIQADVTKAEQVDFLLREAGKQLGEIDVLINNAGTYPTSSMLKMSEEEWDYVLNTNLRSTFLCTQAVAQRMIARDYAGSIVNISSIEAQNPAPLHSHYNAAKAGVLMHTRSAAHELGPHGIRVNAVAPGLIWTEGLEESWPEGVARWMKAAPLARLGQAADVADAGLFLASPAARWITGANLLVDGGVMTKQIF